MGWIAVAIIVALIVLAFVLRTVKWVFRGLLAVALLLVIGLVVAIASLDSIARYGIQEGATYALGVPTTVDSASVGLFGGTFGLKTLEVKNPQGFASPHFLQLSEGAVAVSLPSLMGEVIQIPQVRLTGLDMNVEKAGGKANYEVIMESLEKLSSGEKPPAEEPAQAKKYVIGELVIEDVVVHLSGYPVARTVKIAPIRLTNVGSGGEPVSMAKLTGIIMRSVFQSLLAGGFELPADLSAGLTAGISQLQGLGAAQLQNLGEEVGQRLGEVSEQLQKSIPDAAGDAVGEAGKKAQQAVGEKLGEGLGGLLGGDRKNNPTDEPQ